MSGPGGGRTRDEMFDIFYITYLRHEHRLRAREVFMSDEKIPGLDWDLLQKMLGAIHAAKQSDWKGKEKRYIPLPESWLMGKEWLNAY